MLKKILMAGILAVALIFGTTPQQAEARDIYVGTSNATGWDCYVMTETFKRLVGARLNYEVTLKMITGSGNVRYLDYTIGLGGGYPIWYRNSQGYSGEITQYGTPIEWNMYQTLRNYYGD